MKMILFKICLIICFISYSQCLDCICPNQQDCYPLNITHTTQIFSWQCTNASAFFSFPDYVTHISPTPPSPMSKLLVCQAHQRKLKVIPLVSFSIETLGNETLRQKWLDQTMNFMVDGYYDGLNIDFEHHIQCNETESIIQLSEFMKLIYTTIKSKNPIYELSFDANSQPYGNRCYDYTTISRYVDQFIIMDYDFWGGNKTDGYCICGANAPLGGTIKGIEQYIAINVSTNNMIMGLPFYGHAYTCIKMLNETACVVQPYSYGGYPCSDAVGGEQTYAVFYPNLLNSTTGIMWDQESSTPFFNYISNGTTYQIWFDDHQSLELKTAYAKKKGFLGTAVFCGDYLDSNNPSMMEQMWTGIKFQD